MYTFSMSSSDQPIANDAETRLAPLRKQIDVLDQQLVALLNQRAQVVVEVGEVKRDTDAPIYAPERERQVLQRIRSHNQGPLPDACLDAIWRELMSGSFALERPLRIGYLGPPGSFSHLAASRQFGASVEYDNVGDIPSIFHAVARKHNDYALVPIENSIEGSVSVTLDGLLEAHPDLPIDQQGKNSDAIQIVAEVLLPVHHNLLSNTPAPEIERICSHPQALAQCRRWLAEQFPRAQKIATSSTSQAAEMATREPNTAAVSSSLAAKLFGLQIQFENIEDNPNNHTRFFVIGHQRPAPTGDDKTSIVFATKHESGALADVLEVFRDAGLNLTHIDKRPNQKTNWQYSFFVDLLGHQADEKVAQALEDARKHCMHLHVLGSFPRAKESL